MARRRKRKDRARRKKPPRSAPRPGKPPRDKPPRDATVPPAREGVLAAVVGGVALAMYLPRVCPTLSIHGDSPAFVNAAATWGVAQPPGYPLYTVVAHLSTWLPLGDLAWRVHLTSAFFHAAAAAVVALLVQRLTGSRAAAVGGALFLAFMRAFFQGSHYAEVFPLNDLFTAVLLLAGHSFYSACRAGADDEVRVRRLLGLALGCGLASAHHQMIALLAPTLALWLGLGDPRLLRRGAVIAKALALFLAPLLGFYALVLVAAARDPAQSWGAVDSLSDLWHLATRGDYGGLFSPFLDTGVRTGGQVGVYLETAWASVGSFGVLLAGLGAYLLWRADRVSTLALLAACVTSGPVFASLNSLPVSSEAGVAFAERFVTMSLVPLGVLVGGGVWGAQRLLTLALNPRLGEMTGLVFALPLFTHAGSVDLADDRRGAQFVEDLMKTADDGALVLITGDALNGITTYWCGVRRRCGERVVFSPGQMHLPWRVEQLRRRHPGLELPEPAGRFLTTREIVAANLGARAVYVAPALLDREPPLRDLYGYVPEWLLLRVVAKGSLADHRERFLERARRFAAADGCAGCGVKRTDLVYPSLETSMVEAYVDAFINHARIARLYYSSARLAEELEDRALEVDPVRAHELL